jgi:RHS repeat-associated protein
LTSRRDDRGVERFQHDSAGRVVRHERPGGGWTGYAYDGDGALPSRVFGPSGWSQTVSRSGGVVQQITDADGVVLSIDNDGDGSPIAVTDGLGATTRLDVDPSGEVAAVALPDGARWTFSRDDAGRLLSLTTPLGDSTVFEWTPGGRLRSVVDPAGGCTRYEHGDHGEVVAATDALGGTVSLTWDRWEQLVAVSSGTSGDRRWELDYSPLSLVTTVRDPAGHPWRLAHDAEGRITGVTDPLGHRRVWDFDRVGDLVREVAEDGGITHHVRDDAGRVVAVVDPAGGTTRITHDLLGRVVRTESPDGEVVTRSYTPAGRLSAEGSRTFEYDAAGRLVAADGTSFSRDPVGRVVAVTDPDGLVISHTYDAAGQVVTTSVDGQEWHASYDHAGRIVSIADPLGAETRFTYDALGRVLTATDALGHTTHYDWDADGRCTGVTDPLGNTTRYEWDARGLCTTAVDPLRQTTTITYDATTRPIAVHLPTGQQITHALDPTSRLLELAVSGHDHPALSQSFTSTGLPTEVNATSLTWSAAGRLLGLGDGWEWAYGDQGPVVAATDPSGRTTKWSHDAVGRVTAVRQRDSTTTYAYDVAGQLVRATDESDGGTWTFGYDPAGRLSTERRPDGHVRLYGYDALHRLLAVTGPDAAVFAYDPLGRRTERTDATGTTRYGWDDLGRLAWIERPDGDRRTFDVDPFGSLTRIDDTTLTWDPNGPIPELRAIGNLPVPVPLPEGDWRGSLRPTDAWGLPSSAATSDDRSFAPGPALGFLGELEVDGLVWLRNRVYDPATRQFLSPDPLPGDPGSPVLANPYHYAGNDPIGQVDPLGLKPMSMADYEQYRKVTTGVQWKNVIFAAEVALSVALMFTPLGPANAARMFAMAGPRIALSAGQKMAGMAINCSAQTAVWELGGQKLDEGLAWSDVRWGTVAKGTVFGGIGTMFGGAVGPRLGSRVVSPFVTRALHIPGKPANVVSSWATSSVLLGTTSAGYESYDLTSLPGSDGVFRPANVIASTVSAIPYTVAGGFVAPVRPAIPVPVTPVG